MVLSPKPSGEVDQSVLAEAAQLLDLNPAQLSTLLGLRLPLPAVEVSDINDAERLQALLQNLGIDSLAIPMAEMMAMDQSYRVRALAFSADELTGLLATGGSSVSARLDEIVLLVTGRLVVSRAELEQRRKRGGKQTVDSRQLFSDESVLDFYFTESATSWRIRANAFDFSCLGSLRSATAFENYRILINFLSEKAPQAQLDDSYSRIRSALEIGWPIEPRTSTGEWRRRGAGKFNMTTITTTDNEEQFTRYSRLRFYLTRRNPQLDGSVGNNG